jgi:hypothetical protein
MSFKIDVRGDIKRAQKLKVPRWILLSIAIFCFPVFWIFDQYGNLNEAVPIIDVVVVFAFVIIVKRTHCKELWFWATIIVLAIVHGCLLWYIPWTSGWIPALAAGALVSLDICLILWIVAAVGSWFEKSRALGDEQH